MSNVFVNEDFDTVDANNGDSLIKRNFYKKIDDLCKMRYTEKIKLFTYNNKFLVYLDIASIIIIFSYYGSYSKPELFDGAEQVFLFFLQIGIACIANTIFYICQVYIPRIKAVDAIGGVVVYKVKQLHSDMSDHFETLCAMKNVDSTNLSIEDSYELLSWRSEDKTNVLNCYSLDKYLTFGELWKIYIRSVNSQIDSLLQSYNFVLSAKMIVVLEQIRGSLYNSEDFGLTLRNNDEIYKFISKDNFMWDYYLYIKELENMSTIDMFNI